MSGGHAAEPPDPRQADRLRGWLVAAGLAEDASAGTLAAELLTAEPDAGVGGWIERLSGPEAAEALRRIADADEFAPASRAADAAGEREQPVVPFLPPTLPREMNRQPLGRLPAVLRGGAWILTTRWSLPNRIGPRISRSLWSWRSPAPTPGSAQDATPEP